ncbi:MAG: VWA-like domain-containing protein [Roseobacter sp.]
MTETRTARSQRAARAMAHLPDIDPSLATLALWCDTRDADQTDTVTSGDIIYIGRGFTQVPLQEQIGILGHHILHIALRHEVQMQEMQARFGAQFDADTHNLCTDAIINEILARADHALPRPAVLLRDLLADLLPDQVGLNGDPLAFWGVERLYSRLIPSQLEASREGFRHRCGFTPDILVATPDPLADTKAATWRAHIIRAQAAGGTMGRGIGALLRHLPDAAISQTPWEHRLRRLLNNAVTRMPRQSYRRPRSAWIAREAEAVVTARPRPAFESALMRQTLRPRIVVGFDTSGSIQPVTLSLFAGEVIGIMKKSGAETHVLYFDEEVYAKRCIDPNTPAEAFRSEHVTRDGGTSFIDVLAQADALSPAVIVMLSDGIGTFGPAPEARVIWARPQPVSTRPAFGDVIDLTM